MEREYVFSLILRVRSCVYVVIESGSMIQFKSDSCHTSYGIELYCYAIII